MIGRCACGSRIWRDGSLRDSFHRLICETGAAGFAPSPEQWELGLGDVLPLQVPPAERTVPSEARADRIGPVVRD